MVLSTSPLSPGVACTLTDTFVFFPEGGLWSWEGAQFICGSTVGWEGQGFNALGLTPTSVGQKLVDKYPSVLMPQWNNPKMHFTQPLKGPLGDWASVAHSGKLVINMFFIGLPLFPVSGSHSLAMFPETTSQRNYASKSLSQGNHRPGMPMPVHAYCWR